MINLYINHFDQLKYLYHTSHIKPVAANAAVIHSHFLLRPYSVLSFVFPREGVTEVFS